MTPLLQVYLVRHGETAWSISGQHTGITELRLTAHGEEQARALAPRLDQTVFTRILVSPRARAHQTCELAGCGAANEIEPDLAEWDYGDYEGQRSDDIRKVHADWNLWRDGCPHGEMPAEVSTRADRLIAKLCRLRGNIALFTHGHFGTALAVRWIGLPVVEGQHFSLSPASLSLLSHGASHFDQRVITLWNGVPGQ